MKKSHIALIALLAFAIASCGGSKPRRPAPMKKGRRHGGSVVINTTPQAKVNFTISC